MALIFYTFTDWKVITTLYSITNNTTGITALKLLSEWSHFRISLTDLHVKVRMTLYCVTNNTAGFYYSSVAFIWMRHVSLSPSYYSNENFCYLIPVMIQMWWWILRLVNTCTWDVFSVSDTGGLEEKMRVLPIGIEPITDALPLTKGDTWVLRQLN